jgi:hypothetical protein
LTVFDLPFGGAVAAGGPVPKAARLAVPDADAVAKAEANVRSLFKDEYARRQPAEKKALAQKLFELAEQTRDDPAARYALLCEARDLAAEGNDPALMVQAVEGIAKWYDVDGTAQKLAALEKVVLNSGNPVVLRAVVDLALTAADDAAAADEYDTAVRFAQVASNAARRGNLGAAAVEDGEVRVTQAKKDGEAFAALKPAIEKLKLTPDDPDANLAVGRYRCFVQGRWDDGLKLLAKGSLPALKAAAALDLEAPKAGFADVKVADAWWDYAQAAPAEEKRPAEARARYWYSRAVGGLSGLPKARAEQRMGFTHNAIEYRPGLIGEYLAPRNPTVLDGLKARIDSVIDFNGNEFRGPNTDVSVRWTGAVQAMRPGRYRLVAATGEPVRVKVDGRTVIDTISGKTRKDASVTFLERPSTLVVEYLGGNRNTNTLKLLWVPAGSKDEVPVPAECLFHDRKAESALNK